MSWNIKTPGDYINGPLTVAGSATITGDLIVATDRLKVVTGSTVVQIGATTQTQIGTTAWPTTVIGKSGSRALFGNEGTAIFWNEAAAVLPVTNNYASTIIGSKTAVSATTISGVQIRGGIENATDQSGYCSFLTSPLGGGFLERYRIDGTGISTWSVAGSTAMTLNSTVLAMGVTPAPWATIKAIQVGAGASFFGYTATEAALSGNTYYNGGLKYVGNGEASQYQQQIGEHRWFSAINNTAGAGVTIPFGAAKMTLNASGDLGIGSTSPNSRLQIVGATDDALVQSCIRFSRKGYESSTMGVSISASGGSAAIQNNLVFNTSDGTNAPAERVRINGDGNFGIGGSPTVRLDVQNALADCQLRVKSGTANATFLIDYVNNYGTVVIRKSGTDVWFSGIVGDSSATPTYKIHNGSTVGVQLVSGSTAWTTLSDETLKDIIEPISNAVTKVGALRSVIGKFKTDDSSKRRSFLIAQDVQSVLPEAVDVIGENNELGLRYTEIIPLLVAAIKELTARVQTLEAR